MEPILAGAAAAPGDPLAAPIEREPSKLIEAVSGGWPKVISNLKSLLETGSIAFQEPYPIESARSGKA